MSTTSHTATTMKHLLSGMARALLLVTISLSVGSPAVAYTVDGLLDDWGVVPGRSASDWIPNEGVLYFEEDQHQDFLGPGSGGQGFDAEAIYAHWDSQNLYFAVVTGHRPDDSRFPNGDLAIDIGINGRYELGIETLGNENFALGDLVRVTQWQLGDPHPEGGPAQIASGETVRSGQVVVSSSPVTGLGQWAWDDHYVLEGAVSLNAFSAYAGQDIRLHWTMGCGNDVVALDIAGGLPGATVPNPTPFALFALGVGLLGVVRRRALR